MLLTNENETKELAADGESSPQSVEMVRQEERSAYNDIYLSKLGPMLPSVLMLANFSMDTGRVE